MECGEALEQPEPDIALHIYYAAPGEDVFEIAKRYHVSPAAMLKSNQPGGHPHHPGGPAAGTVQHVKGGEESNGNPGRIQGHRGPHRRRYLHWCGGAGVYRQNTFIKKFMEELLLLQLTSPSVKNRARDELPQSAAGRTIMTTEPKFILQTAVTIELKAAAASRPGSSTVWAIW